jgi:hypothetical protein
MEEDLKLIKELVIKLGEVCITYHAHIVSTSLLTTLFELNKGMGISPKETAKMIVRTSEDYPDE